MPGRDIGEHDPNSGSVDRLLGELIAEVRAVKHNINNTSAKLDEVGRQTQPIKALVEQVKEIREEQERQHFRIAVLEADKNRREGAIGLVEWICKHWPFLGLSALLLAWVSYANGLLK
jgi:hypothetical protein